MKTINPGKQRKELYNAPQHLKRKWIAAHLEENLLLKYDKRSIPAIKGDTVKVMRGSFKGHEDKIAGVNVKKRTLEIEGITMSKADGNKIAKPIHHSNVLITKLNLTDKWRRKNLELGLSEEAKKEIEKEAEIQLKEAEEEKKRLEEEAKALEEAEETEEIIEEEDLELKDKEEKPKKEKEKPKTPTKPKTKEKPEIKKKSVKKSPVKKPVEKKTQTKKKTPSKTIKKGGKIDE
ncbi:MAG: 50S ribosomal protein L24 [Thermoplasmatales archaeon]|nr:MAG: 50S ribosomal protein L24 [Thermoplasmatales archaeon]